MFLSIICFFNNSLLYCTIHCQMNISESDSIVTTEGETALSAPRRRMVAHVFLLFTVRLVFSTMSLQMQ